jgi:predicted nucleic-acid-binding Zn-ribbon protein
MVTAIREEVTMKSECPKCGSEKIMLNVSFETGMSPYVGIVVFGKSTSPFSFPDKRAEVKAHVCSGCGFTELYASPSKLSKLWDAYVSAGEKLAEY